MTLTRIPRGAVGIVLALLALSIPGALRADDPFAGREVVVIDLDEPLPETATTDGEGAGRDGLSVRPLNALSSMAAEPEDDPTPVSRTTRSGETPGDDDEGDDDEDGDDEDGDDEADEVEAAIPESDGDEDVALAAPLTRRIGGYLAGAGLGGWLAAGPLASKIFSATGLTAVTRGARWARFGGRFALAALGVGAGVLAANWILNKVLDMRAAAAEDEHDELWERQADEIQFDWEPASENMEGGLQAGDQVSGVDPDGEAEIAGDGRDDLLGAEDDLIRSTTWSRD